MSNQDYGGQRRDGGTGGQDPRSKAGVSSITADAAEKAKQFASDAAETVSGQARHLLDGQIGAGADLIAAIAGAARKAST